MAVNYIVVPYMEDGKPYNSNAISDLNEAIALAKETVAEMQANGEDVGTVAVWPCRDDDEWTEDSSSDAMWMWTK